MKHLNLLNALNGTISFEILGELRWSRMCKILTILTIKQHKKINNKLHVNIKTKTKTHTKHKISGKRAWNSNFSGGMGKRAWNSGFAGWYIP